MARILVIDDEPGICRALEKFLGGKGHSVRVSSRGETAVPLAKAYEPDLVVLDVRLPGMSGLDVLPKLREHDPALPVIVVTAFGTMDTAVEAMKRGAYDYLLKPLDLSKTEAVIDRGLQSRKIAADAVLGGSGAGVRPAEEGEYPRLVGRTPSMQEVFKRIGAVSLSDVPVLVVGESGTGKKLVARAIHGASPRAEFSFEAVNCAAVPAPLLASEFFGHEEGTLEGAGARRVGRVESARGGSLFLDDICAVPAAVQGMLLRLLEEGEFERVGGTERLEAEVRVLGAATGEVAAAIRDGRLREDLYYRLSVMTIRVPPLRERLADLPILVAHFLVGEGGPRAAVSKDALRVLLGYTWPGNVRELGNALEHALVLGRGGTVLPDHLPDHVQRGAEKRPEQDAEEVRRLIEQALDDDLSEGGAFQRIMDRFEGPLLRAALLRTGGNQVQTAKLLGIHRTTLRGKIRKHGL